METNAYTFTKAAYDPASYEHTLKLEIAKQEAWSADDSIEMNNYQPLYSCGGVLPWVNALHTPVPGVHISMKAVDDVVDASFANGPPDKILHAVCINVEASYDPLVHRGSLQVVSPAEFYLGALMACARDIDKKVPDATLRKWRDTLRSVQFDFVLVPKHARPHVRDALARVVP